MRREPALMMGALTALVTAVIACAAAFGFHLTHDQQTTILAVVAAAAPIVSALLTRRRVTPVGRHRA